MKKENLYMILCLSITAVTLFLITFKSINASKTIMMGSNTIQKAPTLHSHTLLQRPSTFKVSDSYDIILDAYQQVAGYRLKPGPQDKTRQGPKLVVIDPGHGGSDPGAMEGKIFEKDICLDIALRVETILKEQHIFTLLTRRDDKTIAPIDRIQYANEKKAAIFVSIHNNSVSKEHFQGVMTLYYPSESLTTGNLTELQYARLLQKSLVDHLDLRDEGIVARPNLAVLRHANMPSLILELGFMSNPKDLRQLTDESFRTQAAQAIAEGIMKSLDAID